MKKLAKDLKKGDEIKLYFGAAPFPTYHRVLSVHKENGIIQTAVSMPCGSEPQKFIESEEVEVRDR